MQINVLLLHSIFLILTSINRRDREIEEYLHRKKMEMKKFKVNDAASRLQRLSPLPYQIFDQYGDLIFLNRDLSSLAACRPNPTPAPQINPTAATATTINATNNMVYANYFSF